MLELKFMKRTPMDSVDIDFIELLRFAQEVNQPVKIGNKKYSVRSFDQSFGFGGEDVGRREYEFGLLELTDMPETKYELFTGSIFDLGDNFKNKNLYFKIGDNQYVQAVKESQVVDALNKHNLYRKVEVNDRDKFIVEVGEIIGTSEDIGTAVNRLYDELGLRL